MELVCGSYYGSIYIRAIYSVTSRSPNPEGPAPFSSKPLALPGPNMTNCKDLGVDEEGDYFVTECQYEVCNVVGSSGDGGSKAQFWSKYAKRDFSVQKCGILGCGNKAEVGGHMWVKGLRKFCFILPICQAHNKDPTLDYSGGQSYQQTKQGVCLVARNRTDAMSE